MSAIKITMPSEVNAQNPVAGDLFLPVRMTQSLLEEVAQELYCRFSFWRGEWFLDPTVGIPYRPGILTTKQPITIPGQIFKRVITSCPGVQTLLTFNIVRRPSRGALVTFQAKLIDGAILDSAAYGPFIVGEA